MKKYLFITTPIIIALLLLLRYFNVLQGIYAEPVFILLVALILSIAFAYIERNAQHNADEKEVHYDNLDITRFALSIVVVLVHMRPFLGYNDHLDLAFNYIVGRICVPLFFITSGYFAAKKEQERPGYIRNYIKGSLKFYLVWSIIYLPFGIEALDTLNIQLPPAAFPLAILVGFFYTGTFYHLWYFPALLLAMIVLRGWMKRFPMKPLLVISFLLLLLGATETYFGFLPDQLQHFLSTYYFQIFYTTRNFLFFGLFYVALGYYIGTKEKTYVSYAFLKLLLCCVLLVAEALILQTIDRLDSNILLSCIPLVYYLFITLIHTKPFFKTKKTIPYREYYKYYYLVHPFVIYFATMVFLHFDRFEGHYWIQIVIVLTSVHLLSKAILMLKKKYPRALRHL
ncbi:MAG: acyltransferase [Longicatena sp.]